MDQMLVDKIRTLSIEVLLQAHLHAILVGRLFGVPFDGHAQVTDVLVSVELLTEPREVLDFPKSDALNSLLDAIQSYEETVIATAQERSPDVDSEKFDKTCSEFDQILATYQQRTFLARFHAGQSSPVDELEVELIRRGLAGKVVISMTRKSLRERLRTRKLRRRWMLQTDAGRQYLSDLARRRRHRHHIDQIKSKTARLSAKLYRDER